MLLSLRFMAILVGIGTGSLLNAIVALTMGAVLTVLGVNDGASLVLLPSLVLGLIIGGFVAGRMSRHSARFHGAVTGIGVAAITLITARLGGSPARLGEVLILALVSVVFGSIGGIMSERVKR